MTATHSHPQKQKAQIELPELMLKFLQVIELLCKSIDFVIKQLLFSHYDTSRSIREYQKRQADALKQQQELTEVLKKLSEQLSDNK